MSHRGKLVLLPPNRVWRTYPGGATLDRISGTAAPQDSHLAEDWIGSVTRSRIPGREQFYEGVSQVFVGGATRDLRELIDADAGYFLGEAHVARHGTEPMLLVKFLDSAIRLHFQCHPSREFAQEFLNSPSGKTEAYHILGVRDGEPQPYFYMGFQNPPSREDLRRWIETQDTAAMERRFIGGKPGSTVSERSATASTMPGMHLQPCALRRRRSAGAWCCSTGSVTAPSLVSSGSAVVTTTGLQSVRSLSSSHGSPRVFYRRLRGF
jgi:mannose-6-phosphate isomerase